jgi:hypothetical protein
LLIDYLEKGATMRQSTTLHLSTNWSSDWSPNLEASLWKESCFFIIRLLTIHAHGNAFLLKEVRAKLGYGTPHC